MDFKAKVVKHWPAYTMGVVVALIFILATVTFQTAEFEHTVLIHLGQPQQHLYAPGLHFKLPYPIDRVWREDKRIRSFGGVEGKLEETQTADGKNVTVSMSVNWRIAEPIVFIERLRTVAQAELELNALMRSAKNAVIGRYRLNQLVNSDINLLKLKRIENDFLNLVAKQAANYGIAVESAGIQHLGFPQDVASSVFERMRAERKRLAERYLGEGKGEAEKIRAQAKTKAAKIVAEAEAQAKMLKAEGEAEAAKYYAVFKKNPSLAIFLRKVEALKRSVGKKTTLILDTDSVPFDLLDKNPLKEKGSK